MSSSGNDGSVEVRVVGSVDSSLTAATAETKAQLASVAASAQISGARMAEALRAVGNDVRKITPEMLGIVPAAAAATNEVVVGAEAATAATTGLRLATSGAIQEYIRLGHEAMTGNFSRIPGSLVVLTSRMGGLTAATIGSVGAIAAAGAAVLGVIGGIAYLTYRQYEAQRAAEAMSEGFALSGRSAAHTADAVAGEVEELEKYKGATSSIATAIVQWEAAHAEVNDAINTAVNQLLPQYVEFVGKKAPEAINTLKEALAEIESGPLTQALGKFDELNRRLLRLSPTESDLISKMIEAGDRIGAVNRILSDLATQGGGNVETLKQKITEAKVEIDQAKGVLAALLDEAKLPADPQGLIGIQIAAAQAAEQVEHLEANLKALQSQQKGVVAVPVSGEAIQQQLQTIAQDITKTDAQVVEAQVKYLKSLTSAHLESASTRLFVERTLAEKQTELARKTSSEIVETTRATENANAQFGAARLRAEIAGDQKLLADSRVTAQEKLGIEKDLNAKRGELASLAFHAETTAAKKELDEQRRSYEEFQAQLQSMRRDDLSATQQIDKLKLESAKQVAQAEFQQSSITAQEKYAIMAAAAQREAELETKALQDDMQRSDTTIEQANHDANQIRVIAERLKEEQAALARQLTADEEEELRKRVAANRAMVSQITGAEDQLISNVLTTNQTLTQDLMQLGSSLLVKELQDDAKYFTARIFYTQAELAADKTIATQGLILHAVSEQGKTAATATGTVQRNALGATENTGFFARVGAQIASWLGLETGKTAASTAQTAARIGDQTAETITAITAAKATAVGEIPAYTAIAAMGAASAMAPIPFVGPALAVAAAAEMNALGATELSLASAAEGQYRVPFDGQLTRLHVDEQVLPARYASGLRNLVEGDSYAGETHNTFAPVFHGIRERDVMAELERQQAKFFRFIGGRLRDGVPIKKGP